jgi:hypothetical protein
VSSTDPKEFIFCNFSEYSTNTLCFENKEFIERKPQIGYGCKSVRRKGDNEGNRQSF